MTPRELYDKTLGLMAKATRKWIENNPDAKLEWSQVDIFIVGALDETGIAIIAKSEDAKNLCRYVDEQAEHECTILQMLGVLDNLKIIQWRPNANG